MALSFLFRVTPQVPQNMQDDLQRLELEAGNDERRDVRAEEQILPQTSDGPTSSSAGYQIQPATATDNNIHAYKHTESRVDIQGRDAPSFSPFPKVSGDNIPPADDAKEEILWNARKHVLHSQNVAMQISWARDVLTWAEIALDATTRDYADKARPATPRIEHELRMDALGIVDYLAEQEHPDALYIRAKWLEFGKFGHRVDKREAYTGYKRAAELGNARSEYRMGMLFEQSNDMSKAKEHYYKGMALKDSAALYRMGMMNLLGQHGETKDYAGGIERIRSAADTADEDAPQGSYVYGMLVGRDLPDITLPDGLLPLNLETARMYIEKAAYLGFAKAQLKMGQAFELCQLGCEFNPSFSLHYYGLAAKQGLPEAALGVSRWFLFGYEGVFKKNEELAFKYAQEASNQRLPTGEFAMGYYYEIGIHVNKSIADARKWYQLAADHGNKDAIGRLESLSRDQSLSKQDHETTTLTRIKSQHGSQRGKRPDRFKQPQAMPTLSENGSIPPSINEDNVYPPQPRTQASSAGASPRVSPHPSPGITPIIMPGAFPESGRTSLNVSTDRPPAFNVRLDSGAPQPPLRPHSAAPYPDDDHPPPLNVHRPRSTAPYPDDDVGAPTGPNYNQAPQHRPGPQADRPMSAFGIKTQAAGPRPMPISHSTGNLQPQPPRGRVASAGVNTQGMSGAYRQPSPGPIPGYLPHPSDARPATAQPYPAGNMAGNKLQKLPPRVSSAQPPAGDFGPRISSRPTSEMPPPQDMRASSQNYERFSRIPGAAGRPERLSSLPPQDVHQPPRVPTGLGNANPSFPRPSTGAGRTGSAPPPMAAQNAPEFGPPYGSGVPNAATMPAKPPKGPATFEDMGIPHGKKEGDCVSVDTAKRRLGIAPWDSTNMDFAGYHVVKQTTTRGHGAGTKEGEYPTTLWAGIDGSRDFGQDLPSLPVLGSIFSIWRVRISWPRNVINCI